MENVTAIITARGGSKGIPGKNIISLAGKPLITYSIKAALECKYIDNCYVTTDDDAISKVSLEYGAEVIERPAELATDSALSRDAVAHVLHTLRARGTFPQWFVLLQPTSPLRNNRHLEECIERFFASGCSSGVSVTPAEHHPWKMITVNEGVMAPVKDLKTLEAPRQMLPQAYRVNGAIYIADSLAFLERQSFFIDPVYPYVMDPEVSMDIDTLADIEKAEHYIRDKESNRG